MVLIVGCCWARVRVLADEVGADLLQGGRTAVCRDGIEGVLDPLSRGPAIVRLARLPRQHDRRIGRRKERGTGSRSERLRCGK